MVSCLQSIFDTPLTIQEVTDAVIAGATSLLLACCLMLLSQLSTLANSKNGKEMFLLFFQEWVIDAFLNLSYSTKIAGTSCVRGPFPNYFQLSTEID